MGRLSSNFQDPNDLGLSWLVTGMRMVQGESQKIGFFPRQILPFLTSFFLFLKSQLASQLVSLHPIALFILQLLLPISSESTQSSNSRTGPHSERATNYFFVLYYLPYNFKMHRAPCSPLNGLTAFRAHKQQQMPNRAPL